MVESSAQERRKLADFARETIYRVLKDPQQLEEALERNPIAAVMVERILSVQNDTFNILTEFESRMAQTENLLQNGVADPN